METKEIIYRFLFKFIKERGYSPSFREIAKACNVGSPSTVQYNLKLLKKDGMIDYTDNVARSVRLTGYSIFRTVRLNESPNTVLRGKEGLNS